MKLSVLDANMRELSHNYSINGIETTPLIEKQETGNRPRKATLFHGQLSSLGRIECVYFDARKDLAIHLNKA